jgi:hypothetical protein
LAQRNFGPVYAVNSRVATRTAPRYAHFHARHETEVHQVLSHVGSHTEVMDKSSFT